MKNFVKRVLVVMIVVLPCFQTNAWAGGEPDNIPVVPDPNANSGGIGPRARARAHYIYEVPACSYFEGEVTILAPENIDGITASVVRVEDNMMWSDSDMGNMLTISVSTDPGTYILTFTLSNGQRYYGEYTLY